MRPGYFKVDRKIKSASLIFPGRTVGDTPIFELRRWLDQMGITEPLVYVQAKVEVPIAKEIVTIESTAHGMQRWYDQWMADGAIT